MINSRFVALSQLVVIYFLMTQAAIAENDSSIRNCEVADIVFIEEEDATCSVSGGQLILIQNLSTTQAYQVWVDRWYMHVQTPDHTNQILQPNAQPMPLGCSIARAGGAQYWTISSVDAI